MESLKQELESRRADLEVRRLDTKTKIGKYLNEDATKFADEIAAAYANPNNWENAAFSYFMRLPGLNKINLEFIALFNVIRALLVARDPKFKRLLAVSCRGEICFVFNVRSVGRRITPNIQSTQLDHLVDIIYQNFLDPENWVFNENEPSAPATYLEKLPPLTEEHQHKLIQGIESRAPGFKVIVKESTQFSNTIVVYEK